MRGEEELVALAWADVVRARKKTEEEEEERRGRKDGDGVEA